MATLTFAYVNDCAGGGHVNFTVRLNAGAVQSFHITMDEFLAPLSQLTQEERDLLAQTLLKIRMAGKTRAQAKADLQAGFTVTI